MRATIADPVVQPAARERLRDRTRAYLKSTIVAALARVPSLHLQRVLAAVVRRLWPGFRGA